MKPTKTRTKAKPRASWKFAIAAVVLGGCTTLANGQDEQAANLSQPASPVLGRPMLISIVRADHQNICPSFSFAQIPEHPDLFLGKNPVGDGTNPCGGAQALNLFRLDWTTHVMSLLHPVLVTPISYGTATITSAYDPYVEEFKGTFWVAFECGGPHIAGASACVAPLNSDLQSIDTKRLSVPVSGEDADPHSNFDYSASAPKLLEEQGHLYMFWSAIRSDKASHKWLSQEERGVELIAQPDGKLMAQGAGDRWLPSHAPSRDVAVLSPRAGDPLRDASVDTEGFLKTPGGVLAFSSVGGHGADGKACLRPHDEVPGCYSLQINRARGNPIQQDAFQSERAILPEQPANPFEYPRAVVGPDGRSYLMAIVHPVFSASIPAGMKREGQTGYELIPLNWEALKFKS